jgi:hypothetical protein
MEYIEPAQPMRVYYPRELDLLNNLWENSKLCTNLWNRTNSIL